MKQSRSTRLEHAGAAPEVASGRVGLHPVQRRIDQSPRQRVQQDRLAQLRPAAAPTQSNGLPPTLRTGIEALSGMDMSHVSVHRNSAKPAQLNALAYAQGSEIHLGPGQERHLPHEAWHVVQQAQGRVKPTLQAKGTPVNDDAGLEREADIMGARALRESAGPQRPLAHAPQASVIAQRKCANLQRAWVSNYEASGLDIRALFTDRDLLNEDAANTIDRGTYAHECIQGRHGAWTAEYGIPPAAPVYPGWNYADMVANKKIYEIKPRYGQDALTQADYYVDKANQTLAGHALADEDVSGNPCLLTRQVQAGDLGEERVDTIKLYLDYRNSRAGEIVYEWRIVNESKEQRKKERASAKRRAQYAKKKQEEKKQEIARIQGAPSLAGMVAKQIARTQISSAPLPSSSAVPVSFGLGAGDGDDAQQSYQPDRFSLRSDTPDPSPHLSFGSYSRSQLIVAVAMDVAGYDDVLQWLRGQGYGEDELEHEAADIFRAARR